MALGEWPAKIYTRGDMWTNFLSPSRTRPAGAVALLSVVVVATLAAQGEKYTARLGWVPIAGVAQHANVSGRGSVTATLTGQTLAIAGTFEGLPGAATAARLHQGITKGARGAAIGDLTVTKGASGTITGTVKLASDQVESLRSGRLYVQVHSEKGMEDGTTLWGWLLKPGN